MYNGRIIKSAVYRQWISATAGLITWQKLKAKYPKPPLAGPCALHIEVEAGTPWPDDGWRPRAEEDGA